MERRSSSGSSQNNSEWDAEDFVNQHCRFADEDEQPSIKQMTPQNHSNREEDSISSFHDAGSFTSEEQPKSVVPLEFARQHIQRIEQDMKQMHERHVSLMREMDTNYKLIEQETQDYYVEFLQKWRELARSKISQYKRQSESLLQENQLLQRQFQAQEQQLREEVNQALRDKVEHQRQW